MLFLSVAGVLLKARLQPRLTACTLRDANRMEARRGAGSTPLREHEPPRDGGDYVYYLTGISVFLWTHAVR